jgi:uncharacterized protein
MPAFAWNRRTHGNPITQSAESFPLEFFSKRIHLCRAGLAFATLLFALLAGCSTHQHRLAGPRSLFYEGQLDQAHLQFEKLSKSHKRDRNVVSLDLAMVELMNGNPSAAEQRLREVRDQFEQLEQASLAESTVSMWTDDQTKAYSGEDYEKVFIRTFLALSSLMQDGSDAESYSLQINEKQHQLAQKAFERFGENYLRKYSPVPFGYYLRGVLREATWHDYDDALQSYMLAHEALPDSPFLPVDIERAGQGVPCGPGMGVLYVFALVGRGPYKVESSEQASSDALLVADRIVSAVSKHSVPPTLAPIKIPAIHVPSSGIDTVGVNVNGSPIGATMMITDLPSIAINTFEAKRNELMARAIARRVIKKATVYAAKDTMSRNNSLTSLAMDAVGVAWEAAESADTRCWGLLPREIQVLRVELPIGTHRLDLAPVVRGTAVGPGTGTQVDIRNGANTYALCYFPGALPIGRVLTSQ